MLMNALCRSSKNAGWSSLVARQAHNLKVAGSNPAPATKRKPLDLRALHSENPLNGTLLRSSENAPKCTKTNLFRYDLGYELHVNWR
jgi:hypothetical protein